MNEDLFIKYFSGKISQEEEKQLLDWIDESDENREIFMRERKLWDLFTLNSDAQSISSEKSVNLKIQTEERGNYFKWITEIVKIAAIFLIGLFISQLIRWGNSDHSDNIVKENSIEVPIGQRVCITLADSTKVWLNAMTKFSFPEKFADNLREVKLDGEALFEVTHNSKAPFIVKTSKHDIKVLGTKFNVYAYSDNPTMETVLINGKVTINKHNDEKSVYEIHPNQMITFGDNEKPEICSISDTDDYINWIDGAYSFDDQLFSSIIQRLERYYEVNITVKRKDLMDYRFTGKFRHSDPLTLILDVVKKSKPFKYTIKGSDVIIY